LRNDVAQLRTARAIGVHRPVITIHGGLPGPILSARIANKVFRWTAWESEAEFINRVVSDRTAGVTYIGGLPPLPGTRVRIPI
jgi:hypothetical protein